MTDAVSFLALARTALNTPGSHGNTDPTVYNFTRIAAAADPSMPEPYLLLYRAGAGLRRAGAVPLNRQRYLRAALTLAPSSTAIFGYLAQYEIDNRAFWRILTVLWSPAAVKSVEDIIAASHTDTARKSLLYKWAAYLAPTSAHIHLNGGAFHTANGQDNEAVKAFQRCLEHLPLHAPAWFNSAVIHNREGRFERAQIAFRRSLLLTPNSPDAWFSYGNSIRKTGHYAAISLYKRALGLRPDHAGALINIGNASRLADMPPPLGEPYKRAVLAAPQNPQAYISLGQIYNADHRFTDARRLFHIAATLAPNDAKAQYNLALSDLRLGKLEAGWQRHHWGKSLGLPDIAKDIKLSQWQPTSEPDTASSDLLIWNDQIGIGEEIMYLSVLPEILRLTRSCTLICSARLAPLIRRSFPKVNVAGNRNLTAGDIGAHPKQISLIKAISLYRKSFADFVSTPNYLNASTEQSAALRQKYLAQTGKAALIGISWKSQTGFRRDEKSIPLLEWVGLLKQQNVAFISLQYGDSKDDIEAVRQTLGVSILSDPDIDALHDLDGLAAQISAMDGVVSISNATVHLAGAVGVPTWMAYPSDISLLWYWFTDRSDSPWYPSLRIMRGRKGEPRAELMDRTARDVMSFLSPTPEARRQPQ